jgi:hypothetical protein
VAAVSRFSLGVALGVGLLFCQAGYAAGDSNLRKAEMFVDRQCVLRQNNEVFHNEDIRTDLWISGIRFNALYGNCRFGYDQHVWFFVGSHFIGEDSPYPSRRILGLWRDSDTIAFMYVLYRPEDGACCASGGGKIVRFQVARNHVRALDPLPVRQQGSATGR